MKEIITHILPQGRLSEELEKEIATAQNKTKILEVSVERLATEAANKKKVADCMADEKQSIQVHSTGLESLALALCCAHSVAVKAAERYSQLLNSRSNVRSTKQALSEHKEAVAAAQKGILESSTMARTAQAAATLPTCTSTEGDLQQAHEKHHLAAAELTVAKDAADAAIIATADAQEAAKQADMELESVQASVTFQTALVDATREGMSMRVNARKCAEAIAALQLQDQEQAVRKAQAETAAAEV